eukprot:944430-Pyramimonas_sp.AAC.1
MDMESSQPDRSAQQATGTDIDLTMEMERIMEETGRQQSKKTLRMSWRPTQDHGTINVLPHAAPEVEEDQHDGSSDFVKELEKLVEEDECDERRAADKRAIDTSGSMAPMHNILRHKETGDELIPLHDQASQDHGGNAGQLADAASPSYTIPIEDYYTQFLMKTALS